MSELVVTCSFPGVDLSAADELCADLSDSLRRGVPEAATARVRENELNQDIGTVLTIVLTSPTVALVVRELSRWAARRYDTHLHLSRSGTEQSVDIKGPLTARHERMLEKFIAGGNGG